MYARITITPKPYVCEVDVDSIEDANTIADELTTDIYNQLKGEFTVDNTVTPISKTDVHNQLSYCSDTVSTKDCR